MRTPILVPPIDDEAITRTVSIWFLEPGNDVRKGEMLLELLIPGISTTLPAPCNGILETICVQAGAEIKTNDTLGWIVSTD